MSCTLGNKMAHSGISSSFWNVSHILLLDMISHSLVIWHGVWSVDMLWLFNQVDTMICFCRIAFSFDPISSLIAIFWYFLLLWWVILLVFFIMQVVLISGLFIVNVGFSVVYPYYDIEVDLCLSFCSVCNNFVGPVLPIRSFIWYWYWLHRYIVSSICHEFDNISLMISESVMYSASMVDDALDCILGVPFFPLLNWGHVLKHVLHPPEFHSFMCWLPAESAMFHC